MSEIYPKKLIEIINKSVQDFASTLKTHFSSSSYISLNATTEKVAMIGILGEYLSGFFAIWADDSFLRKSIPVEIDNENELNDWYCELVNHLLGIVKNKLLQVNIDFNISIPQIVAREQFLQFERDIGKVVEFFYTSEVGKFGILFCFSISSEFVISDKSNSANVLGMHGSGVVF